MVKVIKPTTILNFTNNKKHGNLSDSELEFLENSGKANSKLEQLITDTYHQITSKGLSKKLLKKAKHRIKDKQLLVETIEKKSQPQENKLSLSKIKPKTLTQERFFQSYWDNKDKNFILHGYPGTGKTFTAIYLALKEILFDLNCKYKKILIVRSVVPSRDMGFLPGTIEEKIEIYSDPYRMICNNLMGSGKGYDLLKTRGFLEFTSTSYLRGLSFDDTIIIVDEFQNNCFEESNTILTRLGNNSKIIFCGDIRQNDLFRDRNDVTGLSKFIKITDRMRSFERIEFLIDDIVRSETVKEYIIAMMEIEDEKYNNSKSNEAETVFNLPKQLLASFTDKKSLNGKDNKITTY